MVLVEIYLKKRDGRTYAQTDGRTDRRTMDKLWYEFNIKKRVGIIRVKCFRAL